MKRVVQDVLDRSPRLQALTPPKTREVVQWCRQRGYTPPDPEPPQPKNDDESIEDILTQIDNEPGEFVPVWTWSTSSTGRSFHSVLLKLQADQYFRLSVACVGVLFLHLPVEPVNASADQLCARAASVQPQCFCSVALFNLLGTLINSIFLSLKDG